MYSIRKASLCTILLHATAIFAQGPTDTPDPCSAKEGALGIWLSDERVQDIANCTTITTNLYLNANGSLSLPNLVTVQGELRIHEPVPYTGVLAASPGAKTLLSISIPRLETIRGDLEISSGTLETLDLPSLSTAISILLDTPKLTTWTGTNSLRNIGNINLIRHNISQLEFENLASISHLYFRFDNPSTVYLNGTISNSTNVDVSTVSNSDVSITSDLQNTDKAIFIFWGSQNITLNALRLKRLEITNNSMLEHLSFPLLTHVSDDRSDGKEAQDFYRGRIMIMDNENLQDLSFPSLVAVDSELAVLDNPLLRSFGEGFPVLKTVGRLRVTGNMTSFQLPNPITVSGSVTIDSFDDTFNCSTIPPNFPTGTIVNCTARTASPEHHKPALSYPAKIGLGVGLAVFVVLSIGLGCGFCLWRSHRHPDRSGRAATISSKLLTLWAKESFQKKPPAYPLQDYQRRDEPLPSYQPRPSSTATTLAPDVNDLSRPGTGNGAGPHPRDVAADASRPVSTVSAVSVAAPSPAHLSSHPVPAPAPLPPNYRP